MRENSRYLPTIGIECHVQLKTVSKLFSGASNDSRDSKPNTNVNHIDFGLPGALPVLNTEALTLAVRAALALKTKPQLFSTFDRKHYFYPDLPMGYQITQYDNPIIKGGSVEFYVDGEKKTVGITRAHIEADAGKSTHPEGVNFSLVDLNRAGTPLLEIVSEPEMHSAAEAKAYAKELYLLMRYAGVTEGILYHGNMRFDVNVSVSKDGQLGTRSETKNLNSFRSVEKAVEYEIKRQIEVIESGNKVAQETRGWLDAKQRTITQRVKENADDYRYMPDPDLPPVTLDVRFVNEIEKSMPNTLSFWRNELKRLGLNEHQIEILIEANLDFNEANYLSLIQDFDSKGIDARQIANWLVNIDIPLAKETEGVLNSNRAIIYTVVAQLLRESKLSSTNSKELITQLLQLENLPEDIGKYAEDKGLLQQSDSNQIETIVDEVLKENPKAVEDIKSGEQKAIGFLIGQVMQRSKGQANPSLTKQIIENRLTKNSNF